MKAHCDEFRMNLCQLNRVMSFIILREYKRFCLAFHASLDVDGTREMCVERVHTSWRLEGRREDREKPKAAWQDCKRLQVGEGGVKSVGDRVGLAPGDLVDDLETQPLEREAYAEDDVVRTAHPQRALRLENPTDRAQPPHVELVILL